MEKSKTEKKNTEDSHKSLDDIFIERYLAREGETLKEARKRILNNTNSQHNKK